MNGIMRYSFDPFVSGFYAQDSVSELHLAACTRTYSFSLLSSIPLYCRMMCSSMHLLLDTWAVHLFIYLAFLNKEAMNKTLCEHICFSWVNTREWNFWVKWQVDFNGLGNCQATQSGCTLSAVCEGSLSSTCLSMLVATSLCNFTHSFRCIFIHISLVTSDEGPESGSTLARDPSPPWIFIAVPGEAEYQSLPCPCHQAPARWRQIMYVYNKVHRSICEV